MTSLPLPRGGGAAGSTGATRQRPIPGAERTTTSRATTTAGAKTRSRSETHTALLDRPLTSWYLVVGSAGMLTIFGLVMVLSASSVTSYQESGNSYALFEKQLMWLAVGIPCAFVAYRLSLRNVRLLGYPLLIVSGLGLLMVLVPGFGVSANGATRWVGVGSLTVQPSEVAKLALVIWGGDLLVRKRKLLGEWRHLMVPLMPVVAVIAVLVMMEPDMGTTIVLLLILFSLLWVAGAPGRLFTAIAAGVGTLGLLLAVAEPYRLARLTSFLHPFKDSQVGGYQAVQGIYALSTGGWWGKGLGSSASKWGYLPNANTDFIFAIIGEELGLLGTLLVLVLFGVLGFAGLRIAHRSTDPFARIGAAAITAWLVGQAVVNIGAVVGLLPITGIPLPLISFGGSALVPTLVGIALLASFAKTERGVPARRAKR